MLADTRRATILRLVERSGSMTVADLMDRLQVSDMTVRRDLLQLHEAGLLKKVHGGARSLASVVEPPYADKATQNTDIKLALADEAVKLAEGAGCIGLAGGTTTAAIAARLVEELPALAAPRTIVTNSLRAEQALTDPHPNSGPAGRVLITGGERTPSDALIGPLAERSVENLHVDILFLGSFAADPARGLFTPNLTEASFNRAFMRSAATVCAVFDSSKWNLATVAQFAAWSDIDILITNTLPADVRERLDDSVGRLITLDNPAYGEEHHD
jgi:DeoR/GlpR family transcriptional regulator of sugar metabolism